MKEILITKNKKAYFDYEVLDSWEAGIELFGHEVKSLRNGLVNLKGSYVSFISGLPYVKGMHIAPRKTLPNKETLSGYRDRKIFLHKKTMLQLLSKQKEGGFAVIPLELYFKGSLVKLKVGLCKGRKKYDKRQILKERSMMKEARTIIKEFV